MGRWTQQGTVVPETYGPAERCSCGRAMQQPLPRAAAEPWQPPPPPPQTDGGAPLLRRHLGSPGSGEYWKGGGELVALQCPPSALAAPAPRPSSPSVHLAAARRTHSYELCPNAQSSLPLWLYSRTLRTHAYIVKGHPLPVLHSVLAPFGHSGSGRAGAVG